MDPRSVGPQQRKANLSPLMKALGRASLGEKVNFCPYGCSEENLDDHGYCHHLIGFTLQGDDTRMEPRKPRKNLAGETVDYFVDGTKPVPVPPGSKLERITTSCRVYNLKTPIEPLTGAIELSDAELEEATRPN